MKTTSVVATLLLAFDGVIAVNAVAASDAPIYRYTVQGTFDTTSFSSSVAVGDRGLLTFELDYSKLDTWPAADFGVFPDAVTDVHFSLQPGASGNYPGGSMTAAWQAEVADNSDAFRFILYPGVTPGLNFPNPGSSTFSLFDIILQGDPTLFSFSNSTGDTLGSVIGNQPLNIADFPNQMRFTLWADGNSKYASAVISSMSAVIVPEPTSSFMLLTGLLLMYAPVVPRIPHAAQGRRCNEASYLTTARYQRNGKEWPNESESALFSRGRCAGLLRR